MEAVKCVRAIDDIIFENAGITLHKGTIYIIGGVNEHGVILETYDGERYQIDIGTFEAGFEIAST